MSLFLALPAAAQEESGDAQFYKQRFCAGMDVDSRTLGLQQRADCISSTHAIEVDWHHDWKESIGRALSFSAELKLVPGIILVCRGDNASCLDAAGRAREALAITGWGRRFGTASPSTGNCQTAPGGNSGPDRPARPVELGGGRVLGR